MLTIRVSADESCMKNKIQCWKEKKNKKDINERHERTETGY